MCRQTPRAELALEMTLTSPAVARRFLATHGCSAHQAAVLEDAQLLVSETVTNAVIHAAPPLLLAVDCDGTMMEVRVRDGTPLPPAGRAARPDDENGRGLVLMDVLAEHWGVEPVPPDSKEVWFRLRGTAVS